MRNKLEEDDGLKYIQEVLKVDVIYTNREAKQPFLLELGIKPDLWLDDNPEYIVNNAF